MYITTSVLMIPSSAGGDHHDDVARLPDGQGPAADSLTRTGVTVGGGASKYGRNPSWTSLPSVRLHGVEVARRPRTDRVPASRALPC